MTRKDALKALDTGDDPTRIFGDMPTIPARENSSRIYFDYLYGRCLKVDIGGDEMKADLFDRDHGQGALAGVIESLR